FPVDFALGSWSAVGTMQRDKSSWVTEVFFEALAEFYRVANNGQFVESLPLRCDLALCLQNIWSENIDICPTCVDERPEILGFYRFSFDLSTRKSGFTLGDFECEVPR